MPSATVDGINLSYVDTGGDGTPVVLIHGFPFDSRLWEPQLESLGDRFRFIVPDLRGFGGSDAPEDRSSYSVDSFAGDIKGLLDHLGIERVVLGGLSMGGYIAFAFMRKYGDMVSALVLADTRSEPDPAEAVEKRTNQQNQVASEGTSGLVDALAGALLSESTKANKPDVVETLKTIMKQPDAGFIGALEAMKGRPDSTGDLASVKVPTLILVGENDPLTPPDAARSMHEQIGGSRLVVIPDAGHVSNLEAPEAFTGALGEFLGEL